MSNMNHPSHDYQLPDDSFLYNLDVNDWSMLAHPEGTDQPDDDRGVGEESGWLSQKRQSDPEAEEVATEPVGEMFSYQQLKPETKVAAEPTSETLCYNYDEQQSEAEAKVAIEPTRTKDEGEMVGATKTPEAKAVPGLAREQVIAEVALAGQVGQTAREEEKAKTPWVELEEAEERAMELREQKANLNAVVLFVVMLTLMESQEQEANSGKPHVERLVDDPDWQELGERTGNKVRAEMMEMMEMRTSAAYNKYLRSSDGSKRDIKQERALATKHADDAYDLVKQLYANPGWSPDELLQKELLRLDIEESPDKARLAETLDTVHDLFGVGRDGHGGHVASHDILQIAQHDLPRDGLSDLEQYFAEHDELKDSGCVGAIALYHLRKNPNGDESIKKILQLTEGGSDVAEVADDYYDVTEYDQKLKLIDEMVDQIDQYFDKAGVEDPYRCFTAKRLGRFGGKGNMLYRWVSTCSSEYETMRLSEDRLRQITEKHASFGGVCRYIEWKWKKGLCEEASEIKRGETRRRRNRSSQRTCAE